MRQARAACPPSGKLVRLRGGEVDFWVVLFDGFV
jgi:hypothetical protein